MSTVAVIPEFTDESPDILTVSSHTNKVDLGSSLLQSIQYIENSLVISPGQPSSPPPTAKQSGSTWTIDLQAGRHGTAEVAQKFLNTCGGVGHIFSPSAESFQPEKLNFFFGVKIELKQRGVTYILTIYLGQGHMGLRNNWWIGGPNLAHIWRTGILIMTSPGSERVDQVLNISGGISNFSFAPWLQKSFDVLLQPDWLRDVAETTLISDINLPGTHDSAAFNPHRITPWACHYHTLTQQMEHGVRLLDIRLSVHEPKPGTFEFVTCHGSFGSNEYQSFPSAMDECQRFLAAHGSECLVMSLKVDDWNGISDQNAAYAALKTLLDKYPISTSAAIPTLKDARGKIYLFNRMNWDFALGVPVSWADNTSGAWGDTAGSFKVYVQDHYDNLGDNPKQQKFTDFVKATWETTSGQVLLNFASGTSLLPPATPGDAADVWKPFGVYIMNILLGYFGLKPAAERPNRLGWSLFDYASTPYSTDAYGNLSVLQMIIASNFGYEGFPDKFRVSGVNFTNS